MIVLGIESSCDETAAALVKDGRKTLGACVNSQIQTHALYGGVVPEVASREHIKNISGVVRAALDQAGMSFAQVDAIAVTHAPGLIGSLLVGVNYAKGLAMALNVPLVGVHHLRSHVAANYLVSETLTPPFLALVISGGHSHIVAVDEYTKYTLYGYTFDDAPGEVYDKVARVLGLSYPGGVQIDALAKGGDKHLYALPNPQTQGEYCFSFSGLKTAVINLVHTAAQRGDHLDVPGLCASFNERVADILCTKAMACAKAHGYTKIVVAGGVAANSAVREKMKFLCEKEGVDLFIPPLSLCGDNAQMVAAQGYFELLAGHKSDLSLNGFPTHSIE